jgi:hypothetical protein
MLEHIVQPLATVVGNIAVRYSFAKYETHERVAGITDSPSMDFHL